MKLLLYAEQCGAGDTTETTCAAVWQAADTEDKSATTMMVAGSSTGQVTIWTSEQR